MKKSILSFGGIMMLFLLVFSCTEEQENIKLPDEDVNLKGEVKNDNQEEDERGKFNATHLLTYLHGYINSEVSNEFQYYENIPERKEANWFFEYFEKRLKSGSDTDNWVLDKIESGEIYIFGTSVKDAKVAALIFSEGLDLHEGFDGKKGIFFDSNTPEECRESWGSWGEQQGKNCFCFRYYGCYAVNDCWWCANENQNFNLDDYIDFDNLIDIDPRVINPIIFDIIGSRSVSDINIGEPILQF